MILAVRDTFLAAEIVVPGARLIEWVTFDDEGAGFVSDGNLLVVPGANGRVPAETFLDECLPELLLFSFNWFVDERREDDGRLLDATVVLFPVVNGLESKGKLGAALVPRGVERTELRVTELGPMLARTDDGGGCSWVDLGLQHQR